MNVSVTPAATLGGSGVGALYSWRWLTAVAVTSALLLAAVPAAATSASTSATESDALRSVIVQATASTVDRLKDAVLNGGGTIVTDLPIINGFSADAPARTVKRLEASGATVTADARLTPHGKTTSGTTTTTTTTTTTSATTTVNTGTLSAMTRITGAQQMWAAGYTGRGVDVAVIDTGIAPVAGLNETGKVVDGPDLSFDSQNPDLAHNDSYGHGTHMASIIGGRDPGMTASAAGCKTCLNSSGFSDTTKFAGMAPEARLVDVKVGATDGAVDVSQVIAALNWVVQYGKTGGLNIRVVNLSYGTDAVQDHLLDPLSFAAEVAWRNDILVVVSGGNDGTTRPDLANPAYNPLLLAVGAVDPKGTLDRIDDAVPPFASRSTTKRNVDIIAPGVSVEGLKSPGSYSDVNNPTASVGTRFMKGSGTSQAAAVVSGAAALILQRFPTAKPDQIKEMLISSADSLEFYAKPDQGKGQIDLAKALSYKSLPAKVQELPAASGLGSLDAARGSYGLLDGDVELRGEYDIFGKKYEALPMSENMLAKRAWGGGSWNGSRWSGDDWLAGRWSSTTWASNSWAGISWSASRWSGMVWDASRWSGTGWSASRWSGSRWSASRWSQFGWQ